MAKQLPYRLFEGGSKCATLALCGRYEGKLFLSAAKVPLCGSADHISPSSSPIGTLMKSLLLLRTAGGGVGEVITKKL
jgi:hypothetical protein